MDIREFLRRTFLYQDIKEYDFTLEPSEKETVENGPSLTEEEHEQKGEYTSDTKVLEYTEEKNIFPSIDVNLEYLKSRYNSMVNSDIVIRNFTLTARNKQFKAFLFYIDGMVDTKLINDFILNPLMLRNQSNTYHDSENQIISEAVTNNITVRKIKKFDMSDYIYNCLIPQNSVNREKEFSKIFDSINSGNCALFIDTLDVCFDIDVKGFKQRGIDTPKNEIVVRGSQEAFTESIRTNTSLLRRIINNENLMIENIAVGSVSKTKCAVCYLKNIANNDLVAEVRYRLNNIKVDYILSSGQLEQLIEDHAKSILPQLIATERPDRAADLILEGRVVIITNGVPYVLIAPGLFFDYLASPEDLNLKYQFSNFFKFLRFIGLLVSVLLPGLYMAIATIHVEFIPTELLLVIIGSRESVPFPIFFEILIMEISLELIREAGVRVPTPLGQTIGIVGALVLGQAAVDASIVSPILIIIVAFTGIASFTIPDFSLGLYSRLTRFFYIILGYFLGLVGIGVGIFINAVVICSMKSFGVSYLAPLLPNTGNQSHFGIFLIPAWKRESRDAFLATKKEKKEKHISMEWKFPKKA